MLGGCVERGEVISVSTTPKRSSSMSAGAQHGCAVIAQRVHCWGANEDGQLGVGTAESQPAPAMVTADARFTQVTTGSQHTCALDDLGEAYCWGGNQRGQLGQGDREPRFVPARVPLPAPATVIVTKFRHTCALLLDTALYCWGDNEEGEIGQADSYPADVQTAADALAPVAIPASTGWRAISTGDGHSCGVSTSGELWCWGRNSDHELGADTRVQVREPVLVTSDGGWLSVSAGQNHTCALKQDRSIWCWGLNTAAAGGEGAPLGILGATELESPTQVGAGYDWSALDTNTFHTCAITRDSELYCWGRNAEGQLGLRDLALRSEPALVDTGMTAVSAGRFATCTLTDTAEVRCTGENASGQLGTGDYERRSQLSPLVLAP